MSRKHGHYHKDVSHLKSIDVYRVIDLFGVTDGAAQHALKKLLCAGQRGNKTFEQDMREAYDTLARRLQMFEEDRAAPVGDGIADDTAAVQRGGTLPARTFLPEQLPPFHCTTPGCQEPANKFGLCTVHLPSESEATHRDAGGVRYKQDPAGRWLQWGLDSWFYWSSDPKAVPGYLQALPAYDGHD